jgi:hypothetical protein
MDSYFSTLNAIVNKRKLSNRILFAIQDVVDLRQNGWKPRRDDYRSSKRFMYHPPQSMCLKTVSVSFVIFDCWLSEFSNFIFAYSSLDHYTKINLLFKCWIIEFNSQKSLSLHHRRHNRLKVLGHHGGKEQVACALSTPIPRTFSSVRKSLRQLPRSLLPYCHLLELRA